MNKLHFFILALGVFENANGISRKEDSIENAIEIEDAPFVAIVLENDKKIWYLASILSEYWLLTINGYLTSPGSNVTVWTGVNMVHSNGQEHEVDFIISQESTGKTATNYSQVALIKLKNPIFFGPNQKPIRLAEPNKKLKAGNKVKVFHYTDTYFSERSSDKKKPLKLSSLEIMSSEKCNLRLESYYKNNTDYKDNEKINITQNNKMFCTEAVNRPCLPDFGSPAVFNGKLVGFSWFGLIPCGGYPILFNNINFYYDWILEQVPELKKK